jgi:hypothetical protein
VSISGDSRHLLTLVETFEITGPFADYKETVTAFCRKIEQDGIADVLAMQFYASQDAGEAYLILTLKSADAFDNHSAFVRSIDEVRPYMKTARLKQMRAFGAMNAERAKQLQEVGAQRGVDFEWVPEHVTGFIRTRTPGS